MKLAFPLSAAVAALGLAIPSLALAAAPAVGDMVGKTPEEVTAALEKGGCTVTGFGAEDGFVEAKCTDAGGQKHEVYIDPKTGLVANLKLVN